MANSTDLNNRFAVRAKLLNEMTDQQARRLAAAVDQPPADAQDLLKQPDKLMAAWNYTPSATPEQDFWTMHDQTLQSNMAKLGTDAKPEEIVAAHNDAETQALNAIYPYRADLVGIGTRVIEDQVKQADRISRIVDGRTDETADTGAPMILPTGGPA